MVRKHRKEPLHAFPGNDSGKLVDGYFKAGYGSIQLGVALLCTEKKDGDEDPETGSEAAVVDTAALEKRLSDMQNQIAHIEKLLEKNMNGEKNNG